MKVFLAAAVSAAMAGSLFSAEALKPAEPADFTGWVRCIKKSGEGIRLNGNYVAITIQSAKKINVDLKKKYRITCDYRIAPGGKNGAKFYFAPVCYDKNGNVLNAAPQNCYPGTDTVLAAPAQKGDKTVTIKDGAKWVVQWGNIAFNTKPDFSDLPNNEYAAFTAINKKGDVWELTLAKPLAKDYPAGTNVREQRNGASFRYMLGNVLPTAEWQQFSRVISGGKGETEPGYPFAWRIATAQAGIVIFTNGKPADIEFRNISIVEEK